MLTQITYHNVNDKYWYSAINPWGNRIVVALSKDDWQRRVNEIMADIALDPQCLEQGLETDCDGRYVILADGGKE